MSVSAQGTSVEEEVVAQYGVSEPKEGKRNVCLDGEEDGQHEDVVLRGRPLVWEPSERRG